MMPCKNFVNFGPPVTPKLAELICELLVQHGKNRRIQPNISRSTGHIFSPLGKLAGRAIYFACVHFFFIFIFTIFFATISVSTGPIFLESMIDALGCYLIVRQRVNIKECIAPKARRLRRLYILC